MRPSPKRHNLARLRLFLKLGQNETAELAGCSRDTIQSVELGRLRLSERLARKISDATGIAADWLLENNLKAPLLSVHREPFTIDDYEVARKAHDLGVTSDELIAFLLGHPYAMIFSAWMSAIFIRSNGDVAMWKVGKFLEQLSRRYGHDRTIVPLRRLRFADLQNPRRFDDQVKTGIKLAKKFIRDWEARKLRRDRHRGRKLPTRKKGARQR
jgi:transcriptional regulator with XRE-family HTH domain